MATTVADLEVRATGDTRDAEAKLDSLDSKVNKTSENTRKAGMAFMGMGTAVMAGLGLSINTAANFEQAISGIGAVAGLAGDQLESVRQKALQLGADTSFSAMESAAAMETLLKAGMPLETVLKDGAQAALDLAAATGTDVVLAAELMTNAMNVFGESAGSATDVADLFTGAANASASSVDSLALGFAQSAQVAQMAGFSIDDLTTTLALFSQHGLQGSDAGTSLKTMLLSLMNPSAEAADALAGIGFSMADMMASGDPLTYLTETLTNGFKDLDPAIRNSTMAMIFGSDATRAAAILFDEGADGVANMRKEMDGQATAAEQAKARMDNLKGSLETLKGSIETAMIMVGSAFTPVLNKLAKVIQGVVQWFTTLSPRTQKLAAMGLALAGAFLFVVGAAATLAPMIGVVTAGLALLVSPVALIIGAIILLGAVLTIAYKKNFLGFGDGVRKVAGILLDAVKGVLKFAGAIIDAFKSGKKISDIVGDFPKPLQKFMKGILLVTDAIGDLVAAWRSGGFEHMLDVLPEKLAQVKKGLSIFADALKGALKAGVQAAIDYLRSVDWGAVFSAIWQGIKTIVPMIGQALALMPQLVSDMVGSIRTGFAPIDQILDSISQAWAGWAEIIRGIFNGDIRQVFDGFKTLLGGLGGELLGLAKLALIGLRAGFEAAWPYVVEFVSNIPGWILAAIGAVGSWLWQKGQDFISGLKTGADDFWTSTLKPWFEGLPDLVKEAIGDVLSTLKTKGDNLLAGMKTGVINLWNNNLKPWFENLPTYAKNAIGDVLETLKQKGTDLIQGLANGASATWDAVIVPAFNAMPGLFIGAFDGAIDWLYGAGKDLIQGLANGIYALKSTAEAAAQAVRDAVLGILKDVPGFSPIEHVGQYFGGKLGMGFAEGIAAAIPDTIKAAAELTNGGMAQMARATPIVPTAPVTAQPSGPRSIIYQTNHYTVSIDQLEDVARAAEFVRDLPGERELVLGGAFAM